MALPGSLAFATRCIHAGAEPHPATGARVQPIFHTNGFAFESQEHGADIFAMRKQGFSYSRGGNPTVAALERRVAALEGGTMAIGVASGQSAWMLTIMTLCATGDEYVGATQLFGGSLGLMRRLDSRFGIKVNWADPEDPAAIEAAITPKTKAIIIESIINPTGTVVDLDAIAAIARRHRLPLVVDSTLASPALQRPLEHGADIVIHSASKFFVGNGTAIGGIIVDGGRFAWAGDDRFPLITEPWPDYDGLEIPKRFPKTAFGTACRLMGLREMGPGLSPMNAFLMLTGIETLPLRMRRHCRNTEAVAGFLAEHPKVGRVSYPMVPGHPNHNLARRYCPDGAGSIFIADLKGGEAAAKAVLGRARLFSHLVNIGETRSLIAHPASTTHRQVKPQDKAILGITNGTLRFSIGIEDAEDLIADLDQALAA